MSNLRWHKHVRHVLVLAQQRKVEQDLQRLRISCHDDELGDAAVQSLGRWGITEYKIQTVVSGYTIVINHWRSVTHRNIAADDATWWQDGHDDNGRVQVRFTIPRRQ